MLLTSYQISFFLLLSGTSTKRTTNKKGNEEDQRKRGRKTIRTSSVGPKTLLLSFLPSFLPSSPLLLLSPLLSFSLWQVFLPPPLFFSPTSLDLFSFLPIPIHITSPGFFTREGKEGGRGEGEKKFSHIPRQERKNSIRKRSRSLELRLLVRQREKKNVVFTRSSRNSCLS